MYWNAGHYFESSPTASRLQLASFLSDLPLGDALLPWAGVVGTLFSLRSLGKALTEAGERTQRQRQFWVPILSPAELRSHRVVCGGLRSAFADEVRGRLVSKASSALLELLFPPVLQTLHPFQSSASFVEGLIAHSDVAGRLTTLGEIVSKALVTTNRSPLQFLHRIRLGSPKLLLPVGGQVSNTLVEEQLRDTRHLRKHRVVATMAEVEKPYEITLPNELASIRRKKGLLLLGVPQADEHSVLDSAIRYELWKGGEPAARPHAESAESGLATDYAYVVLSRLTTQEAVLSIQALHPLGLTAMSLFHSPYDTLGTDAESFRNHALAATRAPRSVGFEAILKIQRLSMSQNVETPRSFEGEPTRSNRLKVSVHTPPSPIIAT